MFELPKLDYKYNALEPFIDELTMETHYSKHHQAYLNNLNNAFKEYPDYYKKDIVDILKNLDTVPSNIKAAVVNHGGGYYNHSLFWKMMTPEKGTKVSGSLENAITKSFGSFDKFKESFSGSAATLFGSGWAWLVKNSDGSLEVTTTQNQNNPVSDGKKPILGLDVWEHAYYLKYKNVRPDYIKSWWNVVNWNYVSELFES